MFGFITKKTNVMSKNKQNSQRSAKQHDNWNLNYWREYAANTIYIRPRVKTNDVIAKQQIGESERIKITHFIREASI